MAATLEDEVEAELWLRLRLAFTWLTPAQGALYVVRRPSRDHDLCEMLAADAGEAPASVVLRE